MTSDWIRVSRWRRWGASVWRAAERARSSWRRNTMMACSSTMGGCPFTVILGPLDLTSVAMLCSLATLLVDRSLPSGEPGGQGGHGKARMGHGPRWGAGGHGGQVQHVAWGRRSSAVMKATAVLRAVGYARPLSTSPFEACPPSIRGVATLCTSPADHLACWVGGLVAGRSRAIGRPENARPFLSSGSPG